MNVPRSSKFFASREPGAFWCSEHGGMAPFVVLGLAGAIMAGAYAFDATRMTTSAAQVKRATDAAVLAVSMERLGNADASMDSLRVMAANYVRSNLGMDSALSTSLSDDSIVLTESAQTDTGATNYEVAVTFQPTTSLLSGANADVRVASTAQVFNQPTEVVLALPNVSSLGANGDFSTGGSSANMAALARLGKEFTHDLLGTVQEVRASTWLALVPYAQEVNVHSDDALARVRDWAAPQALKPRELSSLFLTYPAGLADGRMPDRRQNRLCLLRGLDPVDRFFWEESPSARPFTTLGWAYHNGEDPSASISGVSWYGPEPIRLPDENIPSQHYMTVNSRCPVAPVLPLTNNVQKVEERLDMMRGGWSHSIRNIGLGWAAMAVSPGFRGDDGWGDREVPHDFSDDETNRGTKSIVMLAWVNSGSVNETDSTNLGNSPYDPLREAARNAIGDSGEFMLNLIGDRMRYLCEDLRERKVTVHLITVRSYEHPAVERLENAMAPAWQVCTEDGGSLIDIEATDFVDGEDEIAEELEKIVATIKTNGSYVRLVK